MAGSLELVAEAAAELETREKPRMEGVCFLPHLLDVASRDDHHLHRRSFRALLVRGRHFVRCLLGTDAAAGEMLHVSDGFLGDERAEADEAAVLAALREGERLIEGVHRADAAAAGLGVLLVLKR